MNPILILVGLGALAVWAFSDTGKAGATAAPQGTTSGNSMPPRAEQDTAEAGIPARQSITVEMLREIFDDGERPLTRRDAVGILRGAPYFVPKTNAYRALVPSRRFASHLQEDDCGRLHFRA